MKVILLGLLKDTWEKSSLLTKILLLWAFGPAFIVYMSLGYKQSFKNEIKAEVAIEREAWAKPLMTERNAQIAALNTAIVDIKKEMTAGKDEVRSDIREIRTFLYSRYK